MTDPIPTSLARTVDSHGKAVAAGDTNAVLADFLPDRIGQLIASARVPSKLKAAEVRAIREAERGRFDAVIRYTQVDDQWFELRSRWVRFEDGSWRVLSVRNIPETSPWMDITGPSDDGLDAPHWAGLRQGNLVLQRCRNCAKWIWAPQPICPSCHSFELAWETVEPAGTIYSWTRTWQPFTPESTGHLPYVVVVIELPAADDRRLVGVLAHADGVTPRIGAAVRGEIEQPPDNRHWPLMRWYLEKGTL
ncbi:hypothetical protein A5621_13480 [Mycobacterium colombiense]|uniref:Zn-ribbon domain-containing OB-fold protein n=1 Tax=Mycobacterium colombiense TaxID=339268 RepID=UPI0007FC60F2|nr:zinc ribbon domain-containing protein [Mycobacterium colombiense]OBJ38366.1 hypothetical protein A5621_13480 [Mycobacterium colombiense]